MPVVLTTVESTLIVLLAAKVPPPDKPSPAVNVIFECVCVVGVLASDNLLSLP